MPRFHCPAPLATGLSLSLPPGAARHVQVLRTQPGDVITLFNGEGGEFDATVTRMGRSDVEVEVGAHHAVEREAPRAVHLLAGITANERMDWLVEKATELGVASITPLVAERSVLKLKGERADKKIAHWQSVAVAAAEQCGRNRVPQVYPAVTLQEWLKRASATGNTHANATVNSNANTDANANANANADADTDADTNTNTNTGQDAHSGAKGRQRWVLSLAPGTQALSAMMSASGPADRASASGSGSGSVTVLSGPEGGLSPAEEAAALAAGFQAVTLGPRVLRAETAPLAVLAALSLSA